MQATQHGGQRSSSERREAAGFRPEGRTSLVCPRATGSHQPADSTGGACEQPSRAPSSSQSLLSSAHAFVSSRYHPVRCTASCSAPFLRARSRGKTLRDPEKSQRKERAFLLSICPRPFPLQPQPQTRPPLPGPTGRGCAVTPGAHGGRPRAGTRTRAHAGLCTSGPGWAPTCVCRELPAAPHGAFLSGGSPRPGTETSAGCRKEASVSLSQVPAWQPR